MLLMGKFTISYYFYAMAMASSSQTLRHYQRLIPIVMIIHDYPLSIIKHMINHYQPLSSIKHLGNNRILVDSPGPDFPSSHVF